jgi:hypothetical protein
MANDREKVGIRALSLLSFIKTRPHLTYPVLLEFFVEPSWGFCREHLSGIGSVEGEIPSLSNFFLSVSTGLWGRTLEAESRNLYSV